MAAGSSHSAEELLDTAQRRQFVLEERRTGMTLKQIADGAESRFGKERLPKGWDDAYVAKDISRELEKLRQVNRQEAEELRELELDRLDALMRGLWPKAAKGDTQSVQKVLNVMERRAKLLGLDAPEQFEGNVSVLASSEYRELRVTLMGALKDFPEARAAIAEALDADE